MPDELSEFPSDEFSELPGDALSELSADAFSEDALSADALSTDALSADALSEVPADDTAAVPGAIPPEAPAETEAEPKPKREPGRFAQAFNVYNAMLMVSFFALLLATLLLAAELGRYGFTVRPPQR